MSKEKQFISNSMKLLIEIVFLSILGATLVFGYYKSQETKHSIDMSESFQLVSGRARSEIYNNYSLLKAVIYDLEQAPTFDDNNIYNTFKQYPPRNSQIEKMTFSDTDGKILYVLDGSGSNVTDMYRGLSIESHLVEIAPTISMSNLEIEMKRSIYSDQEVDILYPVYKQDELSGFFSITIDVKDILEGSAFEHLLNKIRLDISNSDGSSVFQSKLFSGKNAYVYNIDIEDISWVVQIESKEDVMDLTVKKTIALALGLICFLSLFLYLEWKLFHKGDHINELKRLKNEIETVAYTDSLTGLSNRLSITNQINDYINNSKETDECAIIFLDLDNFKNVNDVFGHDHGDELLKSISKVFKEMSCKDNRIVVSRLGGDEFVVLFKDIKSEDEIHCFCKDILLNVNNISSINKGDINVSASLGVSFFPYSGSNIRTLFKNADMAMYNSKNMGKNQYSFFNDEMGDAMKRKVLIESKLRTLISNNDFTPFSLEYQPQVQISKSRGFNSAEALIRWNDSDLGFVSPLEFIEIAEATGTIHALGIWVLRKTCEYLNLLESELGTKHNISINISPEQFKDADFINKTISIVEEEGIDPSQITMEITEQVFIDNMIDCIEILNRLKTIGFKLSLDDFGTGYSSLSYLSRLPIDILKIDKSFIDNIETDDDSLSLIEGIFHLSHSINLQVIVEGVETTGQFNLLKEKGVDTIQGYYFSKPLTPEDYIAFSRNELVIE